MAPAESDRGSSGSDALAPEATLSRLVANITHELKTPLHAMLALAQLLESEADGPLTAEQRKQVGMIIRNGEQLLELITDLLNFSRIQSRKQRIHPERCELRSLFYEVTQTVGVLGGKNDVRCETDLGRLAEHFVTDRTLLRQVLSNLLANAVKFSPDGGTVSVRAENLDDCSLLIEIADSGVGIPQEVQAAVFKEFYQVESGDARRFGGVGLGLALVKMSVELLGGKIELKSEQGQGTLFRICIPEAQHLLQRPLVLLVAKEEPLRLALEGALAGEGFESAAVDGIQEALRAISEKQPAVAVVDVMKGRALDLSFVEELRRASWGAELPVIAMATSDEPQDRARILNSGANDYLVKPFDLSEFLARVRGQLNR